MKLNNSGTVPVVGQSYALNLEKICSYAIDVNGTYSGGLEDPFKNIDKSASDYVSENTIISSTLKNGIEVDEHIKMEYQYFFRPISVNNNSKTYTVVKYVGNGVFVDLITNRTITMYDIIAQDFENDGEKNDDFRRIEEMGILYPSDRKEFLKIYQVLLQQPLAINSELEGLETIDFDNIEKIMNLEVEKIMQTENSFVESARLKLEEQSKYLIEMDHAIAIQENALMDETGLKIR